MHKLSFGLIVALVGVATEAPAQAPAAGETIVVTGETLKKARQEAITYVRELGVARGSEQAARWLTGICPNVVGIAEPLATKARNQIWSVARAVRAPLGAPGCKPNLVVVLTADPQSFVRMIARRDSSKIASVARRADREYLFGTAPARWWYDLGVTTRDKVTAQSDAGPHAVAVNYSHPGTTATSGAEIPGTADTAATNQYSASRLWTPTVRAIRAATIVVNFADLRRLGLEAVIDHAALVGLAEVKPGATVDGSILSLFNSGSVRRELSNRDIGFLTGLYSMPLDREALVQRAALVNIMTNNSVGRTEKQ